MGIFATLVVGLIAGWLASLVMKSKGSILWDLLMGIIGGFLGGFLSAVLLGQNTMSGVNFTSIVTALVGAVIVIAIYRFFTRGRA